MRRRPGAPAKGGDARRVGRRRLGPGGRCAGGAPGGLLRRGAPLARGRADRRLPDPVRARPRRDGDGVPRRPRGRRVPEKGRHQAHASGHRERGRAAAVPERTPDRGVARSPQHRAPARRRVDGGGRALLRSRVRRGRAAHRVVRPPAAVGRGPPRALPGNLRRRAARAPGPRRAPRHQARQHLRHVRRRAEAARLRHRQAAPARGRGRNGGGDRNPDAAHDPRVREPRAGARPSRDDRERRVLARRRAVRAALGPPAVPRHDGRPGGVDPGRLRAGSRATERGGDAEGTRGRGAGGRARRNDRRPGAAAARRPRRDRPEGDAQGTRAALCLRGPDVRGHRAAPRGRSRAGAPRHGGVSGRQVRAPPSGGSRGGGARARRARRRSRDDRAGGAPRAGRRGPGAAAIQRRAPAREFVSERVPRFDQAASGLDAGAPAARAEGPRLPRQPVAGGERGRVAAAGPRGRIPASRRPAGQPRRGLRDARRHGGRAGQPAQVRGPAREAGAARGRPCRRTGWISHGPTAVWPTRSHWTATPPAPSSSHARRSRSSPRSRRRTRQTRKSSTPLPARS